LRNSLFFQEFIQGDGIDFHRGDDTMIIPWRAANAGYGVEPTMKSDRSATGIDDGGAMKRPSGERRPARLEIPPRSTEGGFDHLIVGSNEMIIQRQLH
jgi:hypothetical protein